MAMTAYLPNEADAILLREMAAWFKNRSSNPAKNYPSTANEADGKDHYMAFPADPVYGIRGMTSEKDTNGHPILGYGMCQIYKMVNGDLVDTGLDEMVYSIHINPIVNEYVSVQRDNYGEFYVHLTNEMFDGILLTKLEASSGPLTDLQVGEVLVINRFERNEITGRVEFQVTTVTREIDNRASAFSGNPGTYGVFARLNGESRPIMLDCKASEEGIQTVIDYIGLVEGGLGGGGMGSGSVGDGGMGG